MPFTQTDQLPPNPTVKIYFTGLLILQPVDKTCRVFVHNSNSQHNLLIEVRKKRCNKPDVVMARIPGPLASRGGVPHKSDGLLIHKEVGPPVSPDDDPDGIGVKAYNGVETPEGRPLSDSFILSEILSVPPGEVDEVRGRPSILIDDGIFYTAAVAEIEATLTKNDGINPPTEVQLHQVPTIIGANIYLKAPDVVNLTWRQQGDTVSLKLKPVDDVTYEIYINNELLFEKDSPDVPVHDEFGEYFNLLPAVPVNERFRLDFQNEELPPPDRGSSRSPCMSVVIGG